MRKEIAYRDLFEDEISAVCAMVVDSFNEFIAPCYDEDGVREFSKYIDTNSMQERLARGNFVIVAVENGIIVGIIEMRSNDHIALLFVKKEYHHRGIARKLLELAIEKCRQRKGDVSKIDVHSSPYAVRIYEKLGFLKTNPEQVINGIRFTPMTLNLSEFGNVDTN